MSAVDPLPAFTFIVECGTNKNNPDASFQEVSGIELHVETEDVAEVGANSYLHQLPGAIKHSNLVLKRGYIHADADLASWAKQTLETDLNTPIVPQEITVSLLNPNQEKLISWVFENAWPVKWETSSFDSQGNVLTETLEVSYTSVTRKAIIGQP